MSMRFIRGALLWFGAAGACSWGSPARAGDCYAPPYAGYYGYACDDGYRLPGGELRPYDAYLIFQKYPHLRQKFPGLAEQLDGMFGPKGATAPQGGVAPAPGAAAPGGIAPGAPGNGGAALPPATTPPAPGGAAPGAAAPLPTPAAPAGGVRLPAPQRAAPAAEVDPLNPGPDPALPPAAPPADARRVALASPPVRPELEPILGLWQSVSIDPSGQQKVTQVNLGSDGNATLTVDSTLGKVSVKGKFAIDEQTKNFQVASEGAPIVLGKVVSADKDQVVLEREGANVTFTRP